MSDASAAPVSPEPSLGPIPSFMRKVVETKAFENTILVLILIAATLVGIETYPSLARDYHDVLFVLDKIVLWLFVLEAVLKMGMHGPARFYRYFKDPWNVFDFLIVVACFLPADSQFAAVLRLVRVIRALRLVTALPKLQLLVTALIKSIPSIGYVGLLLMLQFYVYAVLGVFLWSENDPLHFGDLQTALLTLFRVATLEDWTDVMYIAMYGSDVYAYDSLGLETKPSAAPILGAAYFVSFVMLGTMIILNLFIGVIMNGMDEAKHEAKLAEQLAAAEKEQVDPMELMDQQLEELESELDGIKERIKLVRGQMRAAVA